MHGMSTEQSVVLVPSRHIEWSAMAARMADCLNAQVPGAQIEHIGSTSVPDLPAKNVVDLLIGVTIERVPDVARQLASAGFDLEGQLPHHCWLSFPARSARTYVLHVVEVDGIAWRNRIVFRELLRRDESARHRYLAVKLAAAREAGGWDDYTRSKDAVVAGLLAENAP